MSEFSTPEQRTEMPTDKRMNKLREDGSLHVSVDLVQVGTLCTSVFALQILWQYLFSDLRNVMSMSYRAIGTLTPNSRLDFTFLYNGFVLLLITVGVKIFLFVALIATAATLGVMLQTKWNVKKKKIDFKWKFINPMAGFQRIFSIGGLVSFGKGLFKLCVIAPLAYFGLQHFAPNMIALIHTSIPFLMSYTGEALNYLFWKIMYVLIPIAIVDFFWGRYQWLKMNKMTKEEVKDERKAVEGDETTKRSIRAKGFQRVWDRIMSNVMRADVVVTNPTHYAVALKYDRSTMSAPIVVAKGKNHRALRIREMAKEFGVPVLERKVLARALYASVDEGTPIPFDLFKAVAEVYAYIMRLKNPYGAAKTATAGRP